MAIWCLRLLVLNPRDSLFPWNAPPNPAVGILPRTEGPHWRSSVPLAWNLPEGLPPTPTPGGGSIQSRDSACRSRGYPANRKNSPPVPLPANPRALGATPAGDAAKGLGMAGNWGRSPIRYRCRKPQETLEPFQPKCRILMSRILPPGGEACPR